MINAATITDEQIRELHIAMREERTYERWPDGTGAMMLVTDLALQRIENKSNKLLPTPASVHAARARCAEIINARMTKLDDDERNDLNDGEYDDEVNTRANNFDDGGF